jgi:hypothetical protein
MPGSPYDFDPVPSAHPTTDTRPLSLEIDGQVVLIPTVLPNGAVMSDAEALRQYLATRRALGVFRSRVEAEHAAGALAGLLGSPFGSA